MKKRVIILGATGSIGRSTVSVIEALPDTWEVVGLAAGSRWSDLGEMAARLNVPAVAIHDEANVDKLRNLTNGATLFAGPQAMRDLIAETDCDCVVSGVVGASALSATILAAQQGRRIALANKEALVIAGSLLMPLARRHGADIIPVDSEHSAIFQALGAGRRDEVHKVYLTASGGPFRTWTRDAMENATLDDALQHPTWDMGPKISIDSATMMNKALEIVEARWLFDLQVEQIQVVIHPESIIHSCVEYTDGSMIAQLGMPDMRVPIQYALTYPGRMPCPAPRLDLAKAGSLSLHPPDLESFPALRLGFESAKRGGTCGAVLNAANEEAVDLFRRNAISFTDIARIVENTLAKHEVKDAPTLDDLIDADRWARTEVTRCTTC